MEEMNLNTAVLDFDFDLLDDLADETIESWSLGHGMVEIGASCCTSGQQTNGSCKNALQQL